MCQFLSPGSPLCPSAPLATLDLDGEHTLEPLHPARCHMLGERLLGGEWRCPVARRALAARTEPLHASVRVSVPDAEQANPVILPSLAPTLVARGRVVPSTASIALARTMASERTPPFIDPPGYARHRPEQTLLYQLIQQHDPAFLAARAAAGRLRPKYLREEFLVV